MDAPPTTIEGHTHAILFIYEHPREIDPDEPGVDWILAADESPLLLFWRAKPLS